MISIVSLGAVSGGVVDCTAAIQEALNIVKEPIVTPAGIFLTGPLMVPSGTILIIYGTLLLKPAAGGSLLNLSGAGIMIEGNGNLDGNASKQGALPVSAGIITAAGSSNITIRGITVQNCLNWPINVVGTSICRLVDVICLNSGTSVEFAAGSTNCWARGLSISGIADEGFAFYGGVTNSGIIGSTIANCAAAGIAVLNDAGQPAPCSNIVIGNNICHGNAASGVEVDNGVGATGVHSGIVIVGNRLYANNTSQTPIWSDLYINPADATGVLAVDNSLGTVAV